ncbi:armadillo repeat-containing protein 2 [Engraulis encrasicolus]|uniref:armadillo repeat-containing protein 2 n=1 Tax=Engraulis encrasicolus TaxID=184585 RepID=UPI002FD6F752
MMERRRGETRRPFYRAGAGTATSPGAVPKTSAEIVQEARQSLRTLCTRRPFTPREEQRQLFGEGSSRPRDARPPSSFSLHARNFEAPDSRPGSGTRLSPLDHKPRLLAAMRDGGAPQEGADDAVALVVAGVAAASLPKPPAEQTDGRSRKGPGAARARLLRAGSTSRLLPPVSPHTEGKRDGERGCRGKISLADPSSDPPPAGVSSSGARAGKECSNGDASGTGSDVTEEALWNLVVSPLLQEFEAVATGGSASEEAVRRVCDACSSLHAALHERGMLGRRLRRRAVLLRSLFRLIDLGSDQLNLQLAKLILALKVSGKNLLNICKLIFKISRSASNDALFQNNSIIDSLLELLRCEEASVSVSVCGEALLYCVATLKFLSGNSALRRLMLEKDCLATLSQLTTHTLTLTHTNSQHTQTHMPARQENAGGATSTHTTAGHILVQLTATLRNLADVSESRPCFISTGLLGQLTTVLQHHHADTDVCTNVARIFSKLSSYNECCLVLAEIPGCCRIFIDLLGKHSKKQDLVVRLLFTLGNLASRSPEARERIYEEKGGVDTLLRLFRSYQELLPRPSGPQGPPSALCPPPPPPPPLSSSPLGVSGREEVLVKLIRVLANLSLHPSAGTALAASNDCLDLLLTVMERSSVEQSEELMVNAAAAINNLSFYQGESSVVRSRHTHISSLMLRLLLSSSMAAVLEATRVFGNLSQIPAARLFIMEHKVHQFVVTLLDSKSSDVCFSACGVLINLSAEPHNRHALRQEGVILKLGECLRDFGPSDWQLAGLVCQTLWNCTEDSIQNGTEELLHTLALYLDEEEALSPWCDEAMRELHQVCWETEFWPVAQRLQRRILNLPATATPSHRITQEPA